MARFFHAAVDVKREARIDLCGDAAWDNFEDFKAEINKELVQNLLFDIFGVFALFFSSVIRLWTAILSFSG